MTNMFDSLIVFIIAMLILVGCIQLKASGGTTHTVDGHAVIEQRITLDFAICDKIEDASERAECIQKIVDLLETASPPNTINGIN